MQKTLETTQDAQTGKKPVARKQTLAKRVREVLLSFGGEAHRTLVIELDQVRKVEVLETCTSWATHHVVALD